MFADGGRLWRRSRPVHVEVDVSFGLPVFTMVGLPDASVRESRDRVRSAIRNSGFEFPPHRDHGEPGAGRRAQGGRPPSTCRSRSASSPRRASSSGAHVADLVRARRAVARRIDSADARRAADCGGGAARWAARHPAAGGQRAAKRAIVGGPRRASGRVARRRGRALERSRPRARRAPRPAAAVPSRRHARRSGRRARSAAARAARSRSPRPAATTCCSSARPAPARR